MFSGSSHSESMLESFNASFLPHLLESFDMLALR
jgi:hypothetical protein